PTYSLYLSNIAAEPGETVNMPVRIKCDNNFESLSAVVSWDDTDLTSSQAYYANSGVAVSSRNGDGYCEVTCYGVNAIDDGIVLYIPFTVPEDAEAGTTYDIDISKVNTFAIFYGDDIYETVPTYGGSITVTNSDSKTISINEKDKAVLTGDYDKYTSFVSDNEEVAYIEDGIIYAVSEGTANITLSNKTETFEITVNVCTPSNFDIDVYSYKEINIPQIANSGLVWTSSNTAVATVSEEGNVYAEKRGTATISAIDPDTGETVWSGTANVINGIKYGDNLYYEKMDNDDDGVDDYVNIVGCEETATSVHIPAEIDGLPVKSIWGFENCTELAEITADEEVTCVDYSKFENTAWFKKQKEENTLVVLNNILLDASTYEGETLEIPDGIEIVAGGVFFQNETVKHVVIPESVKEVSWAFAGCGSVESITVENPDCELYWLFSSWGVPEGLVMYGYEGSTAQTYAEENEITFAKIGEAVVTTTVTTEPGETTETTVSSTVSEGTTTSTEAETTAASGETTVTTTVTGEASEALCGDANNDGDVTVRDCATIARLLAEKRTNELPAWADYNGDGEVTVRDAAALSRAIATATLIKKPFVPVETTPAETTVPATTTATVETSVSVNTEVTTTATTVATTTATETTSNEGWRAAYKEFAKNVTADDIASGAEANLSYVLYNIDDDNIPELVVFGSIGFTAFYSWNETDGIYKIGENFICNNVVPGYYDDNGEFGITAHYWRTNYESQGYYTFEINGKTYVEESIGSTTTYHVEDMGEDTVCERGEEHFTKLDTVSLDGKVSLDEYFDNWTK
ncbi:MAG: Ig-like domain-containing protein, partial [Oscillospiraceae bacterium]|nr:Ig-like domain-containing protein [Oscillospiraceae bacterium]